MSAAEAGQVVRRALDLGINLIDTAADYGESEAILGRSLQGVTRDTFVLCTKFKPDRAAATEGTDKVVLKSEEELTESLERSLRRLGTDHVDLFQLHGVLPDVYTQVRDRFVPVIQRLQAEGKIRFMGLTESFANDHQRETLRHALQDDLYDALLVGYNLITPGPEDDVLPEAQRRDVGILVMCAVRRRISHPSHLEALIADLKRQGDLPATLPERGPLDWLIHDGVDSVTSAAYKFAAGHPSVSCVLTGTANRQHLEQNIDAILGEPLLNADRQRLRALFGPIGRKLGN
ncbi:MAG: aldo/keto reductase [Chloroflexota bacterium]|nr:aldo/keto reductase [Chloroflexota bacterium]